ncbi:MAG: hypothetical protein BWZ03_00478 [bacterium ADurb.BinA186]|nr:MAG: hypothetical protein BWZ03_00478 [bacterium ADurb.BinA186]
MKTKVLGILALVGAAAVTGVSIVGASGFQSNVAATSSKTMVFNVSTNKPTYPTDGTVIYGNQVSYTATALSSGSFASGTAGVVTSISSDNSTASGTYLTSSGYWLVVRSVLTGSATRSCNFSIKWGINAVIENAYITFQATNGITTYDSTVSWTFYDQNGTSHTQTIKNGTAFNSLGYKAKSEGSVFNFSASATGDFSFDVESASFSWSC